MSVAQTNDNDLAKHVITVLNAQKTIDRVCTYDLAGHAIAVLRTNDPKSKYPYYSIRCLRRRMSATINKHRKKFPHSVIVYQKLRVVNPINLHMRLRESGILMFDHNFCGSLVGEADLVTKLDELCNICSIEAGEDVLVSKLGEMSKVLQLN